MPPGVMEHFETATRDPAFFRLHKYIDNLFKLHKDLLPPYTREEVRTCFLFFFLSSSILSYYSPSFPSYSSTSTSYFFLFFTSSSFLFLSLLLFLVFFCVATFL